MPRPPTSAAPRRRLGRLATAALLLLATTALGQDAAAPTTPAAGPLAAFAAGELERRTAAGRLVDPQTVYRYLAAYPMPTDPHAGQRVLSSAVRIMRAFAVDLLRAAADAAAREGAGAITARHLDAAVDAALPRAPTPHDTVVFFPAATPADRVEVETIDLEAVADTPWPWATLLALATDGELAALPPLAEDAPPVLARAVADYGLLLLRLGGDAARRDRDRELLSPHLREAEKTLARLAAGEPATETAAARPASAPPPAAPTPFVDVTAESGIRFRHTTADWLARFRRYGAFAPSFSGGGVSAGDLDGDGRPDLVFCGGRGCAVWRNRGDGTFADATATSGLAVPGEARMAVLADLDDDGDQDAFVTYARDTNRVFENLSRPGEIRFRDATAGSGLEREGDMSGPAIAFDADGDALLDLYVANFGDYLAGEDPWGEVDNRNGQPNRLYRNLGGLRFADVTERSGTGDTGWAQAVSHADLDADGDQDVYVANDFGRNELYLNRGDGTFAAAGAATGADDEFHGMNVAFADLDRDRLPDILVTNIWGLLVGAEVPGEYNSLLMSRPTPEGGVAYERDVTPIPDLLEHDTGWSWAALFFDADLDADDDLFLLNGHTDYATFVQYRLHPDRPGEVYPINNGREANLFFVNRGGVLQLAAEPHGAELADANSRGLALLDYDADGDLDLAVSTFHGEGRLFRNDLPRAGHWLAVELVGDPERGTNRDAIGGRVVADGPGNLYVWRTVAGGEGYLGQSTLRVELGLGDADRVDLEVTWPNGETQRVPAVPADRVVRVRHGVPGFETLPR